MRTLIGILILVGFGSCEKDQPVPASIQVETLADYLADLDTTTLSHRVWAFAGNHPSFERMVDERPFRIQFFKPDSAFNFFYFESDSTQYPDSLSLYRKRDADFSLDPNGLFARFDLKDQPIRNKLLRIAFQTKDSVYLSHIVTQKNLTSSQKTESIENISVNVSQLGLAEFRWSNNSSASQEILWLEDRSGTAFCCVYTNSNTFLFYDLRNVTQDLSPDLFDPKLVLGETYKVHVASLDEDDWMRSYRSIEFVADTIGLQEFE